MRFFMLHVIYTFFPLLLSTEEIHDQSSKESILSAQIWDL